MNSKTTVIMSVLVLGLFTVLLLTPDDGPPVPPPRPAGWSFAGTDIMEISWTSDGNETLVFRSEENPDVWNVGLGEFRVPCDPDQAQEVANELSRLEFIQKIEEGGESLNEQGCPLN